MTAVIRIARASPPLTRADTGVSLDQVEKFSAQLSRVSKRFVPGAPRLARRAIPARLARLAHSQLPLMTLLPLWGSK